MARGKIKAAFKLEKKEHIEKYETNYENTKEYKDRLDYECSVIKKMKYCDYFLINWDFINWSRINNINNICKLNIH